MVQLWKPIGKGELLAASWPITKEGLKFPLKKTGKATAREHSWKTKDKRRLNTSCRRPSGGSKTEASSRSREIILAVVKTAASSGKNNSVETLNRLDRIPMDIATVNRPGVVWLQIAGSSKQDGETGHACRILGSFFGQSRTVLAVQELAEGAGVI